MNYSHVPGHLASPCWKYIKEARERHTLRIARRSTARDARRAR